MDAIIEYASTPEGMLIVVGVAFIGIVLLLTALIFLDWIGSCAAAASRSIRRPIRTTRPLTALHRRTSLHLKIRWPHLIVKPQNNLPEPHPKPLLRSPVCGLPVLTLPPLPNPSCRSPFWNKTRPFSLLQLRNPPRRLGLCRRSAAADACSCCTGFWESPAKLQPKAPDPLAGTRFLLTLPFERRSGLSMAHADLCGIGVEAVFLIRNRFPVWMKTQ